jgi:hypothetical protein
MRLPYKTRARVEAVSDGQTQMVAWTPASGGSGRTRFTVADFQVNGERTRCVCPAGLVSTTVYRSGSGDGVSFRFLGADCAGCGDWGRCRDPEANPTGCRSVFISNYHRHLPAEDAVNRTPAGQVLLGCRWIVEPTVVGLVRSQGCRRARRVGQAAALTLPALTPR